MSNERGAGRAGGFLHVGGCVAPVVAEFYQRVHGIAVRLYCSYHLGACANASRASLSPAHTNTPTEVCECIARTATRRAHAHAAALCLTAEPCSSLISVGGRTLLPPLLSPQLKSDAEPEANLARR